MIGSILEDFRAPRVSLWLLPGDRAVGHRVPAKPAQRLFIDIVKKDQKVCTRFCFRWPMSEAYDEARVFGESLHRLMPAYQRVLREVFARSGIDLTVGQIRGLKDAYWQPRVTVPLIAHLMSADRRGQVARIVGQLRSKALVVTTTHPNDHRSPLIECTDSGHARLARSWRSSVRLASGWPPACPTPIQRFVAMADAMTDNWNEPPVPGDGAL